jgi:hypothetical protein
LYTSPTLSMQLSKPEVEIIEKKYAEKRIQELTDDEITFKAADSIMRIHIITGWTLPDNETYSEILNEEFTLKLKESFSNLNFQEVVFAFRRLGVGVKDWGKSMNLDLICEVLVNYISERERLSFEEEKLKHQPEQKTYTAEELDNMHRADVEAFYQRCLKGIIPPNELPTYYLNILIKDGYMADGSDDLHGFFAYWIGKGYKNIYLKS